MFYLLDLDVGVEVIESIIEFLLEISVIIASYSSLINPFDFLKLTF